MLYGPHHQIPCNNYLPCSVDYNYVQDDDALHPYNNCARNQQLLSYTMYVQFGGSQERTNLYIYMMRTCHGYI